MIRYNLNGLLRRKDEWERTARLTTYDHLNKDYSGEDISPWVIAKRDQGGIIFWDMNRLNHDIEFKWSVIISAPGI